MTAGQIPESREASPALALGPRVSSGAGSQRPATLASGRRPAPASVRPASEDVVKARDAAILGRLRISPATEAALVTVLPEEPGQTMGDRQAACRSALIRLRVKGLARSVEDGWAIA